MPTRMLTRATEAEIRALHDAGMQSLGLPKRGTRPDGTPAGPATPGLGWTTAAFPIMRRRDGSYAAYPRDTQITRMRDVLPTLEDGSDPVYDDRDTVLESAGERR